MVAGRAIYEEIECKSALNKVKGMDFRWSLNPYRGCVHGCHYCFARSFHTYFDLNAGSDFTNIIFVKTNVADVLRLELSRPKWRRETVSIGTATDPYQRIEGKYRLTRLCLEALADWRNPVGLITKGTMAVRDIDVMADIEVRAGCTVVFSVTTLREELWRQLEPGTPSPRQRLRVMSRLVDAGINAGVLIAPVVPGLTDGPDNLEQIVKSAADHGARFVGSNFMYLKPGTKEHFMDFIQSKYPGLISKYRWMYPGSFAPAPMKSRVRELVADLKRRHGVKDRSRPAKAPASRQLSLSI